MTLCSFGRSTFGFVFTLGYIANAAGYEAVYAFGAGFALVGLALMWSMRPRPGTTAAA